MAPYGRASGRAVAMYGMAGSRAVARYGRAGNCDDEYTLWLMGTMSSSSSAPAQCTGGPTVAQCTENVR